MRDFIHHRLLATIPVVLVAAACSSGVADEGLPMEPSTTEAASVSAIGAEPRSAEYWTVWSTCGEDSRADEAAANGGRANGFILMDDLIENPGLTTGDYVIATCAEGVSLLIGKDAALNDDLAAALAAEVLVAELNLSVGSVTCGAAEEAVRAGHILLSLVGFDPARGQPIELSSVEADSAQRIADLLARYNTGDLCQ